VAVVLCFQLACADTALPVPEDRDDRVPASDDDDAAPPNPLDLGAAIADAKIVAETPYQLVGWGLASAGDVNGDGYGDVVVGAPGDNEGGGSPGPGYHDPGAAYLLHGPLYGEIPLEDAQAKFIGESSTDMAGLFVAPAGDVDGDGLDEFVVGAPCYNTQGDHGGKAYVIGHPAQGDTDLATVSPAISGEAPERHAGAAVAGAVDVNGDGLADLLVGDTADEAEGERTGAAYVILGPVVEDMDLTLASAKVTGEAEFDDAGYALAAAGDMDDDGCGDFLVGAPNDQAIGPGKAYLVHGPASGTSSLSTAEAIFLGEADGDRAGFAVAGARDVDGDGVEDVLVGAPYAGRTEEGAMGIAYLVLGPVTGSFDLGDAHAKLRDEEPGNAVGISVAMAGDVDGDGAVDLLVGAQYAAYLITETVSGEVELAALGWHFASDPSASLGCAVAAAGDVDGDAIDDFLLGACRDWGSHQEGGAAFLFYGGEKFR